MKGYNNDYGGGGNNNSTKPINGTDYNGAGSKSVKQVDHVEITVDRHEVPMKGTANSVNQNYRNGKLSSERYYDSDGKPYLDVDYSNHGNAKTHPRVPHEHEIWTDENGGFKRGKDKEIKK